MKKECRTDNFLVYLVNDDIALTKDTTNTWSMLPVYTCNPENTSLDEIINVIKSDYKKLESTYHDFNNSKVNVDPCICIDEDQLNKSIDLFERQWNNFLEKQV